MPAPICASRAARPNDFRFPFTTPTLLFSKLAWPVLATCPAAPSFAVCLETYHAANASQSRCKKVPPRRHQIPQQLVSPVFLLHSRALPSRSEDISGATPEIQK